jgi:hypothetical protein
MRYVLIPTQNNDRMMFLRLIGVVPRVHGDLMWVHENYFQYHFPTIFVAGESYGKDAPTLPIAVISCSEWQTTLKRKTVPGFQFHRS